MKSFKIIAIAILCLTFNACTDDDDDSVKPGTTITPNEEELITTVEIHLSYTNNVVIDTVSFNDPDGDGGNAPTIDTLVLQSAKEYLVNLKFLDASDPSDIEDITLEIEAEDDEHLVCFETMNSTGISISKIDTDGTYAVGLTSRWTISSSASSNNGTLKLTLKHQPGVKDGTCAPGDTDVEIDFPVVIN